MEPTLDQRVAYARQEHTRLFSSLVDLQITPYPEDGSTDPFSGFQDAGETIHPEPELLHDDTRGWRFGMKYPLERNSNAQLTVGDTLRIDAITPESNLYLYVAHLRASPRTFRTTTRKRYCALVYRLFDSREPVFDPTNEPMIEKIVDHNPAPSDVHTRLYPSNQYLWVDAAALLTYGTLIFVDGVSPPRDNIEKVQYLATHLWLYPEAHGDWGPPNDNYGVAARFCPIQRRDGSRNFPFRLGGFHDRDDVTPSPLLISETWEQVSALYQFADIGKERALIRSEARERKAGGILPTRKPVTPAVQAIVDRIQKRRREGSQDLGEGSLPALKKAKTTSTNGAVSFESGGSKGTKTIQPSIVSDDSPQRAHANNVQMPEELTDAAIIGECGGRHSHATSEPRESLIKEAPKATGANVRQSTATPATVARRDLQPATLPSSIPDKFNKKATNSNDKPKPVEKQPSRKAIRAEMRAQAEKSEAALRARFELRSKEAEVASKKREEAIRADMTEEAKQREEKLRAEIQSLLRKFEDEARASEEVVLQDELEAKFETRERALRTEMETERKQRENALRVELKNGKQREDSLCTEIQCLSGKLAEEAQRSQEVVQEHTRREEALQVELERREGALHMEMAQAQKQREDALRVELSAAEELEKAKLRTELESVSRRDAERCAELVLEREKMAGMKHRIEILEEENGILVAERELGERKARLAALRGKAAI